jgi:methyl-accepting chemotaxis protein
VELDSLEVKITGTATKAINSVDKLINQLTRLSTSLATVNGSSLSGLANGVNQLGSAMQNMNAGTADFTRLAKNITKIGSIDSVVLTSTATSLQAVTKAVGSISAIPQNATQVTEFAKSLGKLGSKSIENAVVNIPKLGNALNGLITTLSRAPTVSQNVIQMTNALANLASQGSKANSLQKSLYGVSTSARTASKSSWNLASAIGKFYATYFMVIRGSKKLIEAIKSTTDYIEAFNYQAVAFGKIGSEWDKDYEKYGYDNATAYAESFQSRVNDTLGKLSGLKVNVQGGLLEESGTKNLGLNIQEITQYASQLASVTNSLGQTGEATTAITKSMTMLAGDISSLFNVDYSTVAQNLQSGLIGQSRALYKYGIDITNATLATYAYNLGISKSVSEMTQMEKQQLRVLAILDQSKVSWGDLANRRKKVNNITYLPSVA